MATAADRDFTRQLIEGLSRVPHVSDGGGRAWFEPQGSPAPRATSGVPRDYRVTYEVGPGGIAPGGSILFEVVPNGGWTPPQLRDSSASGYTTVTLGSGRQVLTAQARPPQTVLIGIAEPGLVAGERVEIHYGAGTEGTIARIAEQRASFWIAVDGDGDGARAYLGEPLRFPVEPGPAAAFVLTLPATARPGEAVTLRLATVDAQGNAVEDFVGEVTLREIAGTFHSQRKIFLRPDDSARAQVGGVAPAAGVVRLRADASGKLRGWSNPMDISDATPRILWGDLHGHSSYSDGSGSPEGYFRFARDIAGLDVVALTDHDYWGPRRLDESPERWAEIRHATRRFHEPGRFVALFGFEWTSWIYGHRHVVYFEDRGEIFSAIDPRYEAPQGLWRALAGRRVLTLAHHSAGGPLSAEQAGVGSRFATDWNIAPDPVLEPVTEISSVHGSSEAADSPGTVPGAVAGNFVRDALDRGHRLGFIGSGDSHSGHPGAVPSARPPGGLAGILSSERTRDGVLEALRARRVYATNGPRIVLLVTLGGRSMGTAFSSPARSEELVVRVVAPRHLERIDLIRSGVIAETVTPPRKSAEWSFRRRIENLRTGEYLYVRAIQKDGGAAWSSPFFVD